LQLRTGTPDGRLGTLSQPASAGHLETETAELGKKGDMLISVSTQFEKDKDGNRTAFTLTQYEIGITDRAELLIEPFFMEWDNPKDGKSFHGMGDLERERVGSDQLVYGIAEVVARWRRPGG
jgi:hypothetical protein